MDEGIAWGMDKGSVCGLHDHLIPQQQTEVEAHMDIVPHDYPDEWWLKIGWSEHWAGPQLAEN